MYRKGKENAAADAFSRKNHEETLSVETISVCQPAWLEEITASYATDAEAIQLLTKLAVNIDSGTPYTLEKGVIKHKGRV